MINDLFVNACILISIVFITVELMENNNIKKLSLNKKSIISGLAFSISSIVLIKFSTFVTPTVFLDFRFISQSASAFYGGPISSIITGLISALFRIFYFGINKNSLLTFASMMSSAIVCALIARKNLNKKIAWTLMIFCSQIIYIILFTLVLDNVSDVLKVVSYLLIGTLFISPAIFYVFGHLAISHSHIEKLKHQASIDFLTGVHNKRNFNSLYSHYLKKLQENAEVFSVLMIDIDFFKKINDTYGHTAGDKVLKDIGYILNIFFQEKGIIGRVGGEEFCVLLQNSSKDAAFKCAESLRKYVDKVTFAISPEVQINITISIGLATYKETVLDMNNVREFADKKLYECKKTGRNKVCS